jgi:hypothetical protein
MVARFIRSSRSIASLTGARTLLLYDNFYKAPRAHLPGTEKERGGEVVAAITAEGRGWEEG